MADALDENNARIWHWMDQYEEAQVNQYSFNVLLLLQLYRTAKISGIVAPTAMHESTGAQLDCELNCNNTMLDFQAQVSTQSNQTRCCVNVEDNVI